jgi:hypothetical protein
MVHDFLHKQVGHHVTSICKPKPIFFIDNIELLWNSFKPHLLQQTWIPDLRLLVIASLKPKALKFDGQVKKIPMHAYIQTPKQTTIN